MGFILMKNYNYEIVKSMKLLDIQKNSIFLGQSVEYPGNLIYKTLANINKKKKIELPVFEDVQMGMSIGLALEGFLPITTYPRFDFLLLAFNQMVNHLDKIPIISNKQFFPKVIIRVLVGSKIPLNAGEQHTQNYVKQVKEMCKTINIFDLKKTNQVYKSYQKAVKSKKPSLMVEYSEEF